MAGRAAVTRDLDWKRPLRTALLGAYVLATFASFPHPLFGTVVDRGLVVSFAGPALLCAAIAGARPRRAATLAGIAGLLAHAAVWHWIYVVTVVYGNAPPFVGVLAPIVLALYPALFVAVFGGLYAWMRERGGGPFLAALLWTVLDYGRTIVLTGFPWATLGYAQHQNPALLGLAPFTAVYGLSFTVALGGAALAEIGLARARGSAVPREAWVALGTVVALHLVGLVASAGPLAEPTTIVRVGAAQGNVDQGEKWSRARLDQTLRDYEELSREAVADGASLVVWPETAVPGVIDMVRPRIEQLAASTGATLVVGAVGADRDPDTGRVTSFYDSAFVIDPAEGLRVRYDKTHLVPFGEYVPLRALLGWFFGAVASGIASDDVAAGPEPVAVAVRAGEHGREILVGIPICYELLFPDLVRRFVDDGAGMLLAITNDAWYGKTGAPHQFLAITALRAAETGVWIVRAANTGVSAVIDPRGRVLERTAVFQRALVVADVPWHDSTTGGSTFYVRHGDVFAKACCAVVAAWVLALAWRTRRGERRSARAADGGSAT